MKKIFLVLGLLGAASFGFASEEYDIYALLYRSASSVAERLAILQNVAEAKIPGAGTLYAEALSQLVAEQPDLKSATDKERADASARLLAELLGDAKYAASAGDLWRVAQSFSNPLVKADALVAIGRIRAPEYLELIVRKLSDLNINPTSDPDTGEKIAYGAILALEKYRSAEGYIPVFFASTGWYSRRIKDQAASSLPLITDDPSEPLTSIIRSSGYAYEIKLLALQKEDESKASDSAKAAVAQAAFEEGWKAATNDVKERMRLAVMRKLAMSMLIKYGSTDAALPLLERSYKEGVDMEETLGAVSALAKNGSDGAARILSSFLMILNAKLKSNALTGNDERLVRAVIPALGATKQAAARPALRMVGNLDWTNAVKVLATEALKQIP